MSRRTVSAAAPSPRPEPTPASHSVRSDYLVLACRPGKVARLQCRSVGAAVTAAKTYRHWGWAVVVLPAATVGSDR